jgi:hypothetical protein
VAIQQYIYSMKAAHSQCTCYLRYCHYLLNVFIHNHIALKVKIVTASTHEGMGGIGDIALGIASFMSLQLDICTDRQSRPLRRGLSAGLQAIRLRRKVWRTEHPSPVGIRRTFFCLVTTPTELTGVQYSTNPITNLSNHMDVICYFGLPRNVMVEAYLLLHGTQQTHHSPKHTLPLHYKTYNDVFLLINFTKE